MYNFDKNGLKRSNKLQSFKDKINNGGNKYMATYEECECIKDAAVVINQANKIEMTWKDYEYDFATRDNTKNLAHCIH